MAALLALAAATAVDAAEYQIDYDQSSVRFLGTHAGTNFVGEFASWRGSIRFDPESLDGAWFKAEFDLPSASTGNKMYDGTLPTSDWFDINNAPVAVFESDAIENLEGNIYRVFGTLTLRGVTLPVTFDFTFENYDSDVVHAQSVLTISRLDFGIGEESDPTAEWVTNKITIELEITAARRS